MAIVAIQTTTRKESNLIRYMDQLAEPGLITEVFLPKREVLKRYKGAWNKQEEILFPGYLFVETPDVTAFFYALKAIPMFARLLGDQEVNYNALTPEEETFIRRIGGNRGDHTFGVSQVMMKSDVPYKKGDHVIIVSGDLKDFEGEIIGFNFHKRKAMIRSEMLGNSVIHVGIEIVQKQVEAEKQV